MYLLIGLLYRLSLFNVYVYICYDVFIRIGFLFILVCFVYLTFMEIMLTLTLHKESDIGSTESPRHIESLWKTRQVTRATHHV